MRSIWINAILLLISCTCAAQDTGETIYGTVKTETESGEIAPLGLANLYWLGTTIGASTDFDGRFELELNDASDKLVVSFIGYMSDTLQGPFNSPLNITLSSNLTIEEVEVIYRKKSTELSLNEIENTQIITEKELFKAACCNLSESFETTPSIDVSYTDAVTGTRQIRMLGLSGPNIQMTRENIPDLRGFSGVHGLSFVPGTWIQGIRLNKGAGSVVNGFESIAGQIDLTLKQASGSEKLYFNTYLNEMGRVEMNFNTSFDVGEKWNTALLLHGKGNYIEWDRNDDGFLDQPNGSLFAGLNRWELRSNDGLHVDFGFRGIYKKMNGGQVEFDRNAENIQAEVWGLIHDNQQAMPWAKVGKASTIFPWRSFGLQMSGSWERHEFMFGQTDLYQEQTSAYLNAIYQSIIANTNHKIKTGVSLQADDFKEILNAADYSRAEVVPGAFFEYTFNHLDKLNIVAGARLDYHNLFGLIPTPRLHIRYAINESTVLRFSGGRGQRTVNLFSENTGIFASSREIIIEGDNSDKPYGLNPEIAWNYGMNFSKCFKIRSREATLTLDLYRTDFENQIVLDRDRDPQKAVFYNLDGRSYSNSIQAQFDIELAPRFDMRLAYRWFDVKTTYDGVLLQKPLLSAHRAFINLGYETSNKWAFDLTVNWQGDKRIPSTASNPESFQMPERSPDFVIVNMQISKNWEDRIEIYAGVENLFNFIQEDPILSSEDPYGPYFDSSLIWGPIFGRNTYVGFRYRLKNSE